MKNKIMNKKSIITMLMLGMQSTSFAMQGSPLDDLDTEQKLQHEQMGGLFTSTQQFVEPLKTDPDNAVDLKTDLPQRKIPQSVVMANMSNVKVGKGMKIQLKNKEASERIEAANLTSVKVGEDMLITVEEMNAKHVEVGNLKNVEVEGDFTFEG